VVLQQRREGCRSLFVGSGWLLLPPWGPRVKGDVCRGTPGGALRGAGGQGQSQVMTVYFAKRGSRYAPSAHASSDMRTLLLRGRRQELCARCLQTRLLLCTPWHHVVPAQRAAWSHLGSAAPAGQASRRARK